MYFLVQSNDSIVGRSEQPFAYDGDALLWRSADGMSMWLDGERRLSMQTDTADPDVPMMAGQFLQYGDLKGIFYAFAKAGDKLPEHVHTEDNTHITIVTNGSVKAYNSTWSVTATAGQILDFEAGFPHTIEALEDNTKVFNMLKRFNGVVDDPGISTSEA